MKTFLQKLFGKSELYISPLGQFIMRVDKHRTTHSLSQQKEIEYYKKIFALRDQAQSSPTEKELWNNF